MVERRKCAASYNVEPLLQGLRSLRGDVSNVIITVANNFKHVKAHTRTAAFPKPFKLIVPQVHVQLYRPEFREDAIREVPQEDYV